MSLVWCFLLIPLIAICAIPFLSVKGKGIAIYSSISAISIITSFVAIGVLNGEVFNITFEGSYISGPVNLRIDALSAWFILLFNFTFLTGGLYGIFYMGAYRHRTKDLSFHGILFVLLQCAILSICAIQNGFVFLIAWEIMALSAFLSILFEHEKVTTVKAGINYLIQSHISILFIMLGFIWVVSQTGSYDFGAIQRYAQTNTSAVSLYLFLIFFIGFAFKAGFVPFHTWLPHAHPAAPSHISGIMSGLLIKIGIFGILRMLLLIQLNYTVVGTIILVLSLITGIYGILSAIIQHNLKKILAYSSVENIGIIGIGIGLGCIGLGTNNLALSSLGFGAALLHTLNHSLFKSLLFFTAGNVYQATHTMNIEKFGGLIKKMPQTAFLFLIAALAISGLPPFNGFISEFMLYSGLFGYMQNASAVSLLGIIFTITTLVLIGGLALFCFTKTFSIVFLGSPRHEFHHQVKEAPFFQLLPLYFTTALICLIGLFPSIFLDILQQPVSLFTGLKNLQFEHFDGMEIDSLRWVSRAGLFFIVTITILWAIRYFVSKKRVKSISSTWGCGYTAPTAKIQYTGSSFSKTYSQLLGIFFQLNQKEKTVKGIFPAKAHLETKPYDKLEKWLVDIPTMRFKSFLSLFLFIQNGKLQFYILYGILFIISIISIPLIYSQIILLIEFLNRL